jgi:hypothetical protein
VLPSTFNITSHWRYGTTLYHSLPCTRGMRYHVYTLRCQQNSHSQPPIDLSVTEYNNSSSSKFLTQQHRHHHIKSIKESHPPPPPGQFKPPKTNHFHQPSVWDAIASFSGNELPMSPSTCNPLKISSGAGLSLWPHLRMNLQSSIRARERGQPPRQLVSVSEVKRAKASSL